MKCKLDIVAGYKYEKSYLKDVFLTLPFRGVPVGQRMNDNKLYLMIMSSSPGILSGDCYDLKMTVENQAWLQVQSQSYQRLFNMDAEATQQLQISVEDDAFFAYVPHPVVPHENSTFKSKTNIHVGDRSRVLISEIITCGRKYHGELFKFNHFQNAMEIWHHNKMVLKDNIVLRPAEIPIDSIGILEEYTHQGTLVFFTSNSEDQPSEWVEQIHQESTLWENMQIGGSLIDGGFVVRALGQGGEQMYEFFLKIQELLWNKK